MFSVLSTKFLSPDFFGSEFLPTSFPQFPCSTILVTRFFGFCNPIFSMFLLSYGQPCLLQRLCEVRVRDGEQPNLVMVNACTTLG